MIQHCAGISYWDITWAHAVIFTRCVCTPCSQWQSRHEGPVALSESCLRPFVLSPKTDMRKMIRGPARLKATVLRCCLGGSIELTRRKVLIRWLFAMREGSSALSVQTFWEGRAEDIDVYLRQVAGSFQCTCAVQTHYLCVTDKTTTCSTRWFPSIRHKTPLWKRHENPKLWTCVRWIVSDIVTPRPLNLARWMLNTEVGTSTTTLRPAGAVLCCVVIAGLGNCLQFVRQKFVSYCRWFFGGSPVPKSGKDFEKAQAHFSKQL